MSVDVMGALLKARAADFVVRENWLAERVAESEATHRYLILRKQGFTTMEAITVVAGAAGIAPIDVTYSGLKDEDGVTEQLVALPIAASLDAAVLRERLSEEPTRSLSVTEYGFGSKPLQIGHLAGNTFQISVRMLSCAKAEILKLRRSINLMFLNYYDLQRFGVPGQPKLTHRIGDAILHRDWRRALELVCESRSPESSAARVWRRAPEDFFSSCDPRLTNFYLAAASSFIWNGKLCDAVGACGDGVVTDSATDGLRFSFVASSRRVLEFAARHPSLPLSRFSFSNGECIEQASSRPTAVQAVMQIGGVVADEFHPGKWVASLGFALPSGCYGTMAVRQLMHFLEREDDGVAAATLM